MTSPAAFVPPADATPAAPTTPAAPPPIAGGLDSVAPFPGADAAAGGVPACARYRLPLHWVFTLGLLLGAAGLSAPEAWRSFWAWYDGPPAQLSPLTQRLVGLLEQEHCWTLKSDTLTHVTADVRLGDVFDRDGRVRVFVDQAEHTDLLSVPERQWLQKCVTRTLLPKLRQRRALEVVQTIDQGPDPKVLAERERLARAARERSLQEEREDDLRRAERMVERTRARVLSGERMNGLNAYKPSTPVPSAATSGIGALSVADTDRPVAGSR